MASVPWSVQSQTGNAGASRSPFLLVRVRQGGEGFPQSRRTVGSLACHLWSLARPPGGATIGFRPFRDTPDMLVSHCSIFRAERQSPVFDCWG